MSPLLVPTLAELDVELNRTVAVFNAASSAHHTQPDDGNRQDEVAHAALKAFEVVTEIIHLTAASIPHLRVKAKALRHLFNAVPESRSVGIEQRRLCQQIIEGLLDDRIV